MSPSILFSQPITTLFGIGPNHGPNLRLSGVIDFRHGISNSLSSSDLFDCC